MGELDIECVDTETGVVAWTVLLFTMVAIIDFLVMCVALRDLSGVWGVVLLLHFLANGG